MSPQDRALKKQLLLMKGEVLRVKLKLEIDSLRQRPLGLAGEGFKAFSSSSALGKLVNTLAAILPSESLRQWLRRASRLFLLWKVLSKFWPAR
ncbi:MULTISPECIES: hypothetical protein [Aquitalea]|jgi:hypothetical protein|uniref:Uncharacterized protein n=1 Tax=Aquitalea magnusonii TaxID=332411 RepID=A0A318IU35_9NEIS|nr:MULTISPECIES: hypothetical protein [Aquitalea]PXX38875.1 hypothetical protein DFR38_13123 [Aquitalea magnusonii]